MIAATAVIALWNRLPVIVRAIVAGIAVSAAGIYPWSFLAGANGKYLVSVPWAIVPMAIYLWALWRYLRGDGWPRATSEARRESLRANPLSGEVWGLAILAGLLGFAALIPFTRLLGRMVRFPVESQPITAPQQMPFITMFLLLVMASIVAGVVEEAAFRGYMLGPIERRHGPVAGILLTGTLFGLAHYTHHPSAIVAMLPFYLAIVAVYGALAHITNSILPGLVIHAGGDIFSLTRLWTTGQPEWQLTSKPPELIWTTGPDAAFWTSLAFFLLFAAAAIWAFYALAATAREERRNAAENRDGHAQTGVLTQSLNP